MGEREANVKQVANALAWNWTLPTLHTDWLAWLTDVGGAAAAVVNANNGWGRAGTWFLKKNDFAAQIDFAFYTQHEKSSRRLTETCGVGCNIHLKFHPLDISAFERMLFIIITDSGRTDGRAKALGVVKSNLKSLSIFIPSPSILCVCRRCVCTESSTEAFGHIENIDLNGNGKMSTRFTYLLLLKLPRNTTNNAVWLSSLHRVDLSGNRWKSEREL